MSKRLSKQELLAQLLDSIDRCGYRSLLLDDGKKVPFAVRVFRDDGLFLDLYVYLWNCTHGGGSARAADEYRVQFTILPKVHPGGQTLLLGWYDGYEVFAAWDIQKHIQQKSKSPSAQVKQDTLANAHSNSFSIHKKKNEIVVAFRPEFLVEYAKHCESLHQSGEAVKDLSVLNSMQTITESDIGKVTNTHRRRIVVQITRKYRAYDFARRVLGAYGYRCAACGMQLELVDAAHIIPVADAASTDETTNGIALCKIHHAAYDNGLLSLDENYKLEICEPELERLRQISLLGGVKTFKQNLKAAILLPSDRRDYPNPEYIKEARRVRQRMG